MEATITATDSDDQQQSAGCAAVDRFRRAASALDALKYAPDRIQELESIVSGLYSVMDDAVTKYERKIDEFDSQRVKLLRQWNAASDEYRRALRALPESGEQELERARLETRIALLSEEQSRIKREAQAADDRLVAAIDRANKPGRARQADDGISDARREVVRQAGNLRRIEQSIRLSKAKLENHLESLAANLSTNGVVQQ